MGKWNGKKWRRREKREANEKCWSLFFGPIFGCTCTISIVAFFSGNSSRRERARDESQQQKKRNVSMHALNGILSVYASCSSFCCFGWDFFVCALLLQWSSLLPTMEFLFTVSFESKWIFVSFSFLFFSGPQRYLFRYFVGYNKEEFRKLLEKKIRLKSRTEKEPTMIWRTEKNAWKFPSKIFFFCFQVEIKREIEFFVFHTPQSVWVLLNMLKKSFIQIQKL